MGGKEGEEVGRKNTAKKVKFPEIHYKEIQEIWNFRFRVV